jgi:hypothetical protein
MGYFNTDGGQALHPDDHLQMPKPARQTVAVDMFCKRFAKRSVRRAGLETFPL